MAKIGWKHVRVVHLDAILYFLRYFNFSRLAATALRNKTKLFSRRRHNILSYACVGFIQFTCRYLSLLGKCVVRHQSIIFIRFRAENGASDFTTILRVRCHDPSLVVHINRWVSKLALGQHFDVFGIGIESLLSLFSLLIENLTLAMVLYNLFFSHLFLLSTCLFLRLKHSSPVIDLVHLFHF